MPNGCPQRGTYLYITQKGIWSDIIQLTIQNAIPHHPCKCFGGGPKLGGVEGDFTVSHVGRELLKTGQQVLVLTEDGAEAVLLRTFCHPSHKLEQTFACGGYDEVLIL